MAGEEWAQRIVEKELKQTVVINDNGSAPGMYDLRIGLAGAPKVAIECVGAVDPIFTETWNVGPAKGPLKLSITGDWMIEISPKARIKAIVQQVEQLLRNLEERGIHKVNADHWLKWDDAALFNEFESLKIKHASCYRLVGTGKVHLGMAGIGGAVDDRGDALPEWVGEFLRDSGQQDVLFKLQRSGATDCHAFLIVTFAGAPWPVESHLTGGFDHLPIQAPDLPPPVTGVWVVSGMGQRGLRWDGGQWQLFNARGEGIDK